MKNKENRWIGTHMKPCIEWPEQIQYIKASSICIHDDLWLLTRSYTGDIWCQYEFREVKVILYSMIDNEIKMSDIYQITRIKRKLFELFNSLSC